MQLKQHMTLHLLEFALLRKILLNFLGNCIDAEIWKN